MRGPIVPTEPSGGASPKSWPSDVRRCLGLHLESNPGVTPPPDSTKKGLAENLPTP